MTNCLPAHNDIVLCCDKDGAMFVGLHENGKWEASDNGRTDVAFWMELPEVPGKAIAD